MTVERDMTKEAWWPEVFNLRFLCVDRLMLVNDFGLLSEERKQFWLDWLQPKYPSLKVMFV